MKKFLFLLILSALFMLAGCGEQQPEEKAAAPVQAQNVAYTQEETPAPTEGAQEEGHLEGAPLESVPEDREPGALPDPEPVETAAESAGK